MITADVVLTHYDPNLPVQLACDASTLWSKVSIITCNDRRTERPVEFASLALTKSERNYVQIDKEAFGIVWSGKHL